MSIPKKRHRRKQGYAGVLVFGGLEVEVELIGTFNYEPGCKGAREKGGMQLEPDDPEGMELEGIELLEDVTFYLDEAEKEQLELQVLSDYRGELDAAAEEAAEARAEMRREQMQERDFSREHFADLEREHNRKPD